jgi:glyoxylase-like metal-dependent hydrolase (beta-lactamase superfamily II)
MGHVRVRILIVSLTGAVGLAALGIAFAPHVYAELLRWLDPHDIVDAAPPVLGAGRMVDDYWAVQELAPDTFAIGEPRYYQQNYAYLLIGRDRALLFDSGTGTRDIRPILAGLTDLPITVLPSHLHYDHLGGILAFTRVAMIDLPETRADVRGKSFTPGRYEFLGMIDHLAVPVFEVTEWLAPDSTIDLGGRVLKILHVPGHTKSSTALWDLSAKRLFAGDFIYPTTLYAALPGAGLADYAATTARLLRLLPEDTTIWSAHCCRRGEAIAAPWLGMQDLRALGSALAAIRAGQASSTGLFPRIYPVNDQMDLETGFPWSNR